MILHQIDRVIPIVVLMTFLAMSGGASIDVFLLLQLNFLHFTVLKKVSYCKRLECLMKHRLIPESASR